MKTTSELYAEAKATDCPMCKLWVYQRIAMYRNMICTTGVGALGRGFNIYIHPAGREGKPFDHVKWVPQLKHTCK